MTLTAEQIDALAVGRPVALTLPEVGRECVLLRADIYARLEHLLEVDNSPDPRAAYAAVLKAWDEEGYPADAELYRI